LARHVRKDPIHAKFRIRSCPEYHCSSYCLLSRSSPHRAKTSYYVTRVDVAVQRRVGAELGRRGVATTGYPCILYLLVHASCISYPAQPGQSSIRSLRGSCPRAPSPFENEKLFERSAQYDPTRWAIAPKMPAAHRRARRARRLSANHFSTPRDGSRTRKTDRRVLNDAKRI
jgi:hypothetical protein